MSYKEWAEHNNNQDIKPKRPAIYYLTWVLIAGTITADLRLLQYDLMWQVIGALIFGCVVVLTVMFVKWTS